MKHYMEKLNILLKSRQLPVEYIPVLQGAFDAMSYAKEKEEIDAIRIYGQTGAKALSVIIGKIKDTCTVLEQPANGNNAYLTITAAATVHRGKGLKRTLYIFAPQLYTMPQGKLSCYLEFVPTLKDDYAKIRKEAESSESLTDNNGKDIRCYKFLDFTYIITKYPDSDQASWFRFWVPEQ